MLLFDCGEGTQLRLLHAGVKRSRIAAVFITHLHGAHFYGLMGLLSTLALLKRREPITVVGPQSIRETVHHVPGLQKDWLPFPITYVELAEDFEHQIVFETSDYYVEARPVEHRTFTAGFRFQEKPRSGRLHVDRARSLGIVDYEQFRLLKAGTPVAAPDGRTILPEEVVDPPVPGASFAYVTDTRPCPGGRLLAREADLLYHEATFGRDLAERAIETGHSTASEAAQIAKDAGAARLLLGHFSARYKDPAPLVEEARQIFKNTEAAEELKRYILRPATARQKNLTPESI